MKIPSNIFTRNKNWRIPSIIGIFIIALSAPKTHPINILINGPTIDILNSTSGFKLLSSIIDAPPIGKSTIFLIAIPLRFAVMECDNSWIKTEKNSNTISKKKYNMGVEYSDMASDNKINKRKLQCSCTLIPKNTSYIWRQAWHIKSLLFSTAFNVYKIR